MVVNADERTAEGQYFAKGDEYGVVDLAQWWAEEACGEHYAAEAAQCHSDDKLQTFHTNVCWYFLLALGQKQSLEPSGEIRNLNYLNQ